MKKGLILSSQELDEFEKELENLGVISKEQDTESSNQSKSDGQLSLSEERAWMLHQQDPLAASGPFSAALRLSGNVDLTRLIDALKTFVSRRLKPKPGL